MLQRNCTPLELTSTFHTRRNAKSGEKTTLLSFMLDPQPRVTAARISFNGMLEFQAKREAIGRVASTKSALPFHTITQVKHQLFPLRHPSFIPTSIPTDGYALVFSRATGSQALVSRRFLLECKIYSIRPMRTIRPIPEPIKFILETRLNTRDLFKQRLANTSQCFNNNVRDNDMNDSLPITVDVHRL